MLVGKINPTAKLTQQNNAFETPVVVEAAYMSAAARPYVIGAAQTNFEVLFGNLVGEGESASFQRLSSQQITLTAEELASWGTDDVAALEAIAAKLPTVVESTVVLAGQNF